MISQCALNSPLHTRSGIAYADEIPDISQGTHFVRVQSAGGVLDPAEHGAVLRSWERGHVHASLGLARTWDTQRWTPAGTTSYVFRLFIQNPWCLQLFWGFCIVSVVFCRS